MCLFFVVVSCTVVGMPLTSCKDCNTEISESAKSCPKCGANTPLGAKDDIFWLSLVGLLVLSSLGAIKC